jgi:hypothetical protein
MAQIIPLAQRAQGRRRVGRVEGGAQILLFLGVRYMRMDESVFYQPSEPKGGGKKRRRRGRG